MKKRYIFSFSLCAGIIVLLLLVFILPRHVSSPGEPMGEKNAPESLIHSTPSSPDQKKEVQIAFAGDMMFDRYIREVGKKKGYGFILASSTEMLTAPDLVVANLEGPITNNPSVSIHAMGEIHNLDNYTFTFSPEILPTLKRNNIQIVTIGNNHILNFRQSGLTQTIKELTGAGIEYFGNPNDPAIPYFLNKNGFRFAFIAWNEFSGQNVDQTLQEIKSASTRSDFVIVFAHWGVEYEKNPTARMEQLAHSFIDTGADLVIGAHTHVIGTHETYHGKRIYYSLGNFVFDQYFSPQVRCGLFLTVTFKENDISFHSEKTFLKENGQTVPAPQGKCAP